VPTYPAPPFDEPSERDDEPPLPEEASRRVAAAALSPTVPVEADPARVLHVRFSPAAPPDRIVSAMEEVRAVLRERPGGTRVVIDLPQGPGRPALPMELRSGVAYDVELLAEVARRLGSGLVDLHLAGD
jgi:hypothetical protein